MTAPPKPPSASAVEMNELVLPTHTNSLGTIFGGTVMAWIDICAAMAAQRHARKVVVTASMEAVDFLAPIKLGHVVCLRAMVAHVGRTSMVVEVLVEAENPRTGFRVQAASAHVTFVALDEDGRPAAVPQLLVETEEDRRRQEQARALRSRLQG
jgi:uncharacterized protein (TIGR00369 family)